jgi:D-galactose 1-dehydrogenase
VWEPGIGVFDPGINALSAITRILPWPLRVMNSDLKVPANKDAPIAASLKLAGPTDAAIAVEFDWDQRGTQTWQIDIATDGGLLSLTQGASKMTVDGVAVDVATEEEYASMYRHFADLIAKRESDIDLSPFRLVADAYLIGRRHAVEAFA